MSLTFDNSKICFEHFIFSSCFTQDSTCVKNFFDEETQEVQEMFISFSHSIIVCFKRKTDTLC